MKIERGFADSDRARIAELYWMAFGAKLSRALGPDRPALRLLELTLDPAHAFCARDPDGTLLGVAGFKTIRGGLVSGGFRMMVRVYGPFGALWRTGMLGLLRGDTDNHRFLVDGIFVAPEVRSRGIGTALITALADEARARGYAELRLDVVEENTRARALYDRLGFIAVGRHALGPGLRWIFGFRAATTMVLPLVQGPAS